MLHFVTVATKSHPQLDILRSQYQSESESLHVLKENDLSLQCWGKNFGVKLQGLYEYVQSKEISDNDIIVFTDAFDVMLNRCTSQVEELESFASLVMARYKSFNAKLVFSAEIFCHPYPNLDFMYPQQCSKSLYPHLNSGLFMGEVGAFKDIFKKFTFEIKDDDQGFWTRVFLSQMVEKVSQGDKQVKMIVLDHNALIFQNMAFATDHLCLDPITCKYINKKSGTSPLFLHFNGSSQWVMSYFQERKPIPVYKDLSMKIMMAVQAWRMRHVTEYSIIIFAILLYLLIIVLRCH